MVTSLKTSAPLFLVQQDRRSKLGLSHITFWFLRNSLALIAIMQTCLVPALGTDIHSPTRSWVPIMAKKISASVGKGGVNHRQDVREVQRLLNAKIDQLTPLRALAVDGLVGRNTINAIMEFQRRVVGFHNPDGRVDPGGKTETALRKDAASPSPPTGSPANLTAQFESTSRSGQTRQMMTGRITINNHTYDFRSGGHGRGYLPTGTYSVTPHRWDRSESGFSVDGVGFSFAVSDAYDSRVGDTRTLLRIHPDGGSPGTNGCIGIVGSAAVQRRFREDMRSEFNRANNQVSLRVISRL